MPKRPRNQHSSLANRPKRGRYIRKLITSESIDVCESNTTDADNNIITNNNENVINEMKCVNDQFNLLETDKKIDDDYLPTIKGDEIMQNIIKK